MHYFKHLEDRFPFGKYKGIRLYTLLYACGTTNETPYIHYLKWAERNNVFWYAEDADEEVKNLFDRLWNSSGFYKGVDYEHDEFWDEAGRIGMNPFCGE